MRLERKSCDSPTLTSIRVTKISKKDVVQTVADIEFIESEQRADQTRTARLMNALGSHPTDVSQPQQLSSAMDVEDKSGRSFFW